MTLKLPLAITLAATLAAPVLAQDASDLLNPRALIADMGLGQILHSNGSVGYPAAGAIAPRVEVATARLDTTVLRSPRPLLRPSTLATADLVVVPEVAATLAPSVAPAADVEAMLGAMDLAAAAAPAGANTLVISGGDTAVVSGTNTAVFQNGAEASRPTLWQRIFGR